MRTRLYFLTALGFALTLVIAPTAGATDWETAPEPTAATQGFDPLETEAPAWGPGYTAIFIPASEFTVRSESCDIEYGGLGYIYTTAGSSDGGCLWAPLDLQPGTLLHGARLFYYDNDASNSIGFLVTRYYGETTVGYDNIFLWDSTGTPGYASHYEQALHTIRYQTVNNDVDSEQGYSLIVCPRANTPALSFKGVRITYQLQPSPAPGTATFGDVPTGHPFFQFVEALADSGITAGCGGGNYCPDDPLTRGQMAVFLTSALGLYWDR